MSDFNANASEPTIIPFCNLFKLKNFVKEPARYKNPENSRCINLFLILFLTVQEVFITRAYLKLVFLIFTN